MLDGRAIGGHVFLLVFVCNVYVLNGIDLWKFLMLLLCECVFGACRRHPPYELCLLDWTSRKYWARNMHEHTHTEYFYFISDSRPYRHCLLGIRQCGQGNKEGFIGFGKWVGLLCYDWMIRYLNKDKRMEAFILIVFEIWMSVTMIRKLLRIDRKSP